MRLNLGVEGLLLAKLTGSNWLLVGCFLPCVLRHVPFFRDVAQGEEEQLCGRFIAREMAAVLHDFSNAHVQALDSVRRVDNAPDLRRISKEGDHLRSLSAPGLGNRRTFASPRALLKCGEDGFGRFGVRRLVDRLQRLGKRFAVLPSHVIE